MILTKNAGYSVKMTKLTGSRAHRYKKAVFEADSTLEGGVRSKTYLPGGWHETAAGTTRICRGTDSRYSFGNNKISAV